MSDGLQILPDMAVGLTGSLDIMGWARRSRESEELDFSKKVGCDNRRILFHIHLACLVINGGTCSHIYFQRIRHNERGGVPTCPVCFRPSVCDRASVFGSALRNIWPGTHPSAFELGIFDLQYCMWR